MHGLGSKTASTLVSKNRIAAWEGPCRQSRGQCSAKLKAWGDVLTAEGPEGSTPPKEDYSEALRSTGICHARVWIYLGTHCPLFLLISTFWNGNVYNMSVLPFGFGNT